MTVFCSSCGTANKDGVQFCTECGTSIAQPAQAQPAQAQPAQAQPAQAQPVQAQPAQPQQIIVNVQQQQQQQQQQQMMGVGMSQDVTSIWMIFWCLIIPLLGIAWYFLNRTVRPISSRNYLIASIVNLVFIIAGS